MEKMTDSVYDAENILKLFDSLSDSMKKAILSVMVVSSEISEDEWYDELEIRR